MAGHFQYNQVNKIAYYEVSPKVVRANCDAVITVKNKYITRYSQFQLQGVYFVLVCPMLDFEVKQNNTVEQTPVLVEADNDELTFTHHFEGEQDYMLMIWRKEENGEKNLLLTTYLYALEEDLYSLTPLKGNTHLHSCYSDGLEEPLQHIGAALKSGFDYIALTDHNNYEGSVSARDFLDKLREVDIDKRLTVLNGEEFSCNFQPMHIISLGAEQAVPKKYYEIKDIPTFETDEEKLRWIVEKIGELCTCIRENGGVSVLCHPYWKPIFDWVRLDAPRRLIDESIQSGAFDAFEVVGGSPKGQSIIPQEQHLLALECMKLAPKPYAFLGQSDSHIVNADDSTCVFGTHYTIAFCRENSARAILDAVKDCQTVAVEETDGRCEYFGSLRLVNFCRYLEKEYFPKAKAAQEFYHRVFELCATGKQAEGKALSDTLKEITLYSYEDLKK